MPSAAEHELIALYQALKKLLSDKDWTQLAAVDQAIAQCLVRYPKASLSERGLLVREHLHHLHDQARVACAEECERLRLLLQRHMQYSEAQNAYGRIDSYREEG